MQNNNDNKNKYQYLHGHAVRHCPTDVPDKQHFKLGTPGNMYPQSS